MQFSRCTDRVQAIAVNTGGRPRAETTSLGKVSIGIDFPDFFPGFGIESTADSIGLAAAAVTGAGIAAHIVATNVRKRKAINEAVADGKFDEKPSSPSQPEKS